MESSKTISIITINLNNKDGLQKTIESIDEQKFSTYELIVIDGGSIDGSLDVIHSFDHIIDYWVSEYDTGIYHALNKGIHQSSGTYCLFLNAGDWLVKNSLSEAAMMCEGEGVIYFRCYRSYSDGRFEKQCYPPQLTMRSFYKRTIGHQSSLIRRDLFDLYGTYNETFQLHADYDFWIKTIILNNVSCKYAESYLCYYDMGGRSAQPSERSEQEINTILTSYLPARVLDDYQYWFHKEQKMEVLLWYRSKPFLYRGLVFFFNVAKRVVQYLPRTPR